MIWVIIAVAFILRLVNLNQSLWLDEAININVAKVLDAKTLVLDYSMGDFHPPLYHLVLKSWHLIASYFPIPPYLQESVFRIPSVLFGTATVFVTYLIGKKLFDRKTGLIAATLIATAPLHIYYSQEARMYMMAAFMASLSFYFFISILKKDTLVNWAGFVGSTALMLYTDYLPYFLIPTYIIYLFIRRKNIKKPTLRAFTPAFILITVLLLPWLVLLPQQLIVGLSSAAASPAWAIVVGSPQIKNLLLVPVKFTIGRLSLDNDFAYTMVVTPLAIFVTFLFLLALLRQNKLRSFLWFLLFIPTVLAFLTAYFVPVFSYFRLVFLLVPFYLIWASAINTVNWTVLTRILLSVALVINLGASTIYFFLPQFQRENWRGATSYVLSSTTSKTLVLFESNYTVAPFDYYSQGGVAALGALESFNADTNLIEKKLNVITKDRDKIYLFQYLSGITDPQALVFQRLSKSGFTNTDTKDFQGVGLVYEFKKQ